MIRIFLVIFSLSLFLISHDNAFGGGCGVGTIGGGGGGGGCGGGKGGAGGRNTAYFPPCGSTGFPGSNGTLMQPGIAGKSARSNYPQADGGRGGLCGQPGENAATAGGPAGAAIVTNGNSITWDTGNQAPNVLGPIQ